MAGDAAGRSASARRPQPSVPEPEPVPEPIPESDDDDGLNGLTVTDSQVSWTQALRLIHLLEVGCRCPTHQHADARRWLGCVRLRLMLTHDGYDLDPAEATQAVDTELFGRTQLTGVEWPLEFFASIVLTCTWPRGAGVVRAMTTLLDAPVTVDGMEIEHRYDPRILTRDAAPGQARRGGEFGHRPDA